MGEYGKRGYLNRDFMLFHLKDEDIKEYEYHYHDFNKIFILISGNVTYCIEGRTYELRPYDIILVSAGEIHRPVVYSGQTYERMIIYVSDKFLNAYSDGDTDLRRCFERASETGSNLLRIRSMENSRLYRCCLELEESVIKRRDGSRVYGAVFYERLLFLEFMIDINRESSDRGCAHIRRGMENDRISAVTGYINAHLDEDLTVDTIAAGCFMNRYYLMHLFKSETGYTISGYITSKRLISARSLIDDAMPATQACFESGFRSYSAFFRAWKKKYGDSPRAGANPFLPDKAQD